MKKISDICVNLDLNLNENLEVNFHEHDGRMINELFMCMQSIFPAFKQAWPTEALYENSKIEWIKAFAQAGLNDADKIKYGLSKYRLSAKTWVPSPGEFIAMCAPEISLVPPMYIALPKPNTCPIKQKSQMDKVRELLGVKKK